MFKKALLKKFINSTYTLYDKQAEKLKSCKMKVDIGSSFSQILSHFYLKKTFQNSIIS